VRASVFGPINARTGGGAYLDHAGDDFEQGQTHRYDMVGLVGIDDLDDIEGVQLYKSGSDDWCVKDVSVLVNNTVVFTSSFAPPCQWVVQTDLGAEPIDISHEQLRGYPLWSAYQIPLASILHDNNNQATLVIGNDQIDGTVETQVGDKMVGTDGYWAPPDAVHVTPYDSQRAKVDLDLKGRAFGSDVGVDVDFDLVAGTHRDAQGNWLIDVTVENPSASVDPAFWQWFFVALSAGAELSIPEEGIEGALSTVAVHSSLGAACNVTASFDGAANLVINATLACT